jgi:hypothetical protein
VPEPIRYRKLPGHRRGFIRSASLWLGPDHLLAVNSLRFREEYKRYYFRDIQALIIARGPRFHLSTRAAAIGCCWLIALASLYAFANGALAMSVLGVLLVATWVYFSAMCSCTCRIHTAVSQDRLPSVYRIWTARRFLRALEPHLSGAQGPLEQPLPDLETVRIGPAEVVAASVTPPPLPPPPRRSVPAFYLLVGCLFANALWNWLDVRRIVHTSSLVPNLMVLFEIAAAIVILAQRQGRAFGAGRQIFAIVTLIGTGLFFYGRMLWTAVAAGIQASARQPVNTAPILRASAQFDLAVALLLGVAGLAVLVFEKSPGQQQGSIVS